MLKSMAAAAAAFALFTTGALADSSPLAPGKPAGLTKAQDEDHDINFLYVIGIGAIVAGIALAASDHHNDHGNATGGGSTGGGSTGGGGTTTTT